MGCHQADAAQQTMWRRKGKPPPYSQRHLLGIAVRGVFALTAPVRRMTIGLQAAFYPA
jgi:hypothetical protein